MIDLKTQLGYFKNVSRVLRKKLGDKNARALLSRAVYSFSVGNNDYSVPFEINSTVLPSYSAQQLIGLVIGNITEVIQVGTIYLYVHRYITFYSFYWLQ